MAVEFAFVAAVPLLLFTIGTFDAVRMVVAKQMCAYAASAGARTGAVMATANQAAVQAAAVAAAPMLKLTASSVTVVVTDSATPTPNIVAFASRARGDTVTVTVPYTFTPVAPGFTKLITKNFSVKSAVLIP